LTTQLRGELAAFGQQLTQWQTRMEQALASRLPGADQVPARLHEAMRYSVLGGGKRIRPALVFATGRTLGLDDDQVEAAACAIELVHVYSLVHDDLPAMDDDDLRRGRPTCHKAYDEATAVLVGDALQPLAFQLLARDPKLPPDPAIRLKLIDLLAEASGTFGMAGGQAIDLASVGHTLTRPQLETMHRMKTGALLRASVRMGALAGETPSADAMRSLDAYAAAVGLAFQVVDDILDVTTDSATLGKTAGKDAKDGKPTYVSIIGLEASRELAAQLSTDAHAAIAPFGARAQRLAELADLVVNRVS
jgi:farnesyl diphosphate synthase